MGGAHTRRNIALTRECKVFFFFCKKAAYTSRCIPLLALRALLANECAEMSASFGMHGFMFECNISSMLPNKLFFVQCIVHNSLFSRTTEFLHCVATRSKKLEVVIHSKCFFLMSSFVGLFDLWLAGFLMSRFIWISTRSSFQLPQHQ